MPARSNISSQNCRNFDGFRAAAGAPHASRARVAQATGGRGRTKIE
jgi:hypothetical protein